jgi:N-formylglutamate amidohydrolase
MLFEFTPGRSPLLVNVPHSGTHVPESIAEALTTRGRTLPDTDWHVHRLVHQAPSLGASLLCATHSRYVIDLNRGPDDQPLYAGPTTGLVPTETFDGDPVYREGRAPDADEIRSRVARYWEPYHAKLLETLEALRERHGHAVLFDVHSIRSRVPRLFDGRLPDLNLGTFDEQSCAPELHTELARFVSDAGHFSGAVNGRFKGGYITRHYGQPDKGIHALQIEIAQDCYMEESESESFSRQRAYPLTEWLEAVIGRLAEWSP